MEDESGSKVGEDELKVPKLGTEQVAKLDAELSKLVGQLDAEKRKTEDYLSKLRYLQADFENYRKRVDREIQEIEEFSVTKVVRSLLPVMDELELAIRSGQHGGGDDQVLEGVKMVLKKLVSALEAEGLARIDALGRPFDPKLHEAAEKVEGEGHPEDRVVEVIRSGFTLKGRVLRPCLVKVEMGAKEQDSAHERGMKKEGEAA